MRIAFVTDPLAGLDPDTDTTVGLMLAAIDRGDEVWATGTLALEAREGRAHARAQRITDGDRLEGSEADVWLDEMSAVFMRTDPPVDAAYLTATFILDLIPRTSTMLVNDPRGLRICNEKAAALQFPALIPPTVITAHARTIADFLGVHGRAVVKPVDGHAGRGVLVLDPQDPNLASLVEMSTNRGTRAVVVQRHLPEVADGNKRLFVLDGRPTAAVWRHSLDGDFRIGAPDSIAPITGRDLEICAELAPFLLANGLRMAGLDVIGRHLIEINVTSPGALRKSDTRLGTQLCAELLDTLARTPLTTEQP